MSCYSAAKLFFSYGLGNAMAFPLSVGATTVLLPQRADPRGGVRGDAPPPTNHLLRRADALCGDARAQGDEPRRRLRSPAAVRSPPARRCRPISAERWQRDRRRRRPRRHRLDRDVPDLSQQPAGRRPLRHRRASRFPATTSRSSTSRGESCPVDEIGELVVRGPTGRRGLLEPARQEPAHLCRRMDLHRRQVSPATPTATTTTAGAPTTCSR